ncbi:acetyltransferase [Vibrio cholerae]|nr:acetyltransferase [Vibrio paracholerae]PUA69994.1 acetyltransferase [Vibrio cholerae]
MQLLCLSLVVMRCQPLRRALCNRREKDRNILKAKVFLCFCIFKLASILHVL